MLMAEGDIILSDLLQCLVECSQKAAKIAQIFRDENDLFQLLVEEKSQLEINRTFVHDFKTLADVLVQETIKRDVGEQFPSLISNIQGEEQNSFQNSLGESISVELTASADETATLLCKVLDGRDHIAESLASVVHSKEITCEKQYSSSCRIPAGTIGIWIDPIDSTTEYIQAKSDEKNVHGIQPYGLKCVSVLIGVYDLQTGNPVLGVVNQPFYYKDPNISKWESRLYWAVHYNSENATSSTLQSEEQEEKIVVLSCLENKQLQDIINSKYRIVHTAGAGYKSLLVACKKAVLYVLSQGTTYFWDTCAPHAILAAQGGGMLKFIDMVRAMDIIQNSDELQAKQMKYISASEETGVERFRNTGGIIAYRDPEDAIEFLKLLHDNGFQFDKPK